MVFLEPYAVFLHFLHFIAGIVSVAACVHILVRQVRLKRDKRVRLHARTLLVAYLTTFALGSLLYPTFRVRVRAEFLDRVYPWATGLFEMKEHAATLALIPVVGIFVLSRSLENDADREARYAPLFRGLVSLVLGVLLFNASVGWYLGSLRNG